MWLYFWSVVVFLLYSREKWSSCWYIHLPSSIWTIFESSIVLVFSVKCLVYQVKHCDSLLIKSIGSLHWRLVSIVPLLYEVCVNCLYHSMTKSNTLHLQTQFRIKISFDLTRKMSTEDTSGVSPSPPSPSTSDTIIKMIQSNKKKLIIGASSVFVLIIIIVATISHGVARATIPHGVARCPDGATGNKIRNNI